MRCPDNDLGELRASHRDDWRYNCQPADSGHLVISREKREGGGCSQVRRVLRSNPSP